MTDLLGADLKEIGEYGMAISQAVCLFNYVQRLMAPTGQEDVEQLTLRNSLISPNLSEHMGDYVKRVFV